jgi:TolA-binding protein
MSFDMKPLEELGAKIAESLGEGPSEERILMQRRDFLAHVSKSSKKPFRLWVSTAVAAAMLAAVLGVLFKMNDTTHLPFWIGGDRTSGSEGQWVRAESAAMLPIVFKGGSEINLSSEAAARIIASTTDEVRIDLASGKVHCSINKNHKTKWQVEAGPYTVHVTGTVFTTVWDPDGSKLDVTVSRGSVVVTGANLSAHGVQLSVGDHLQVDGEKALIALSPDASDNTPAVPDENPSADAPAAFLASEPGPESEHSTDAALSHPFKKSVANRNAEGARGRMLAAGDVEELWQVAMQARYNRDGSAAKTALLTIRKKFKNTERAETAAFLLGRVFQELQGNSEAATKWFRRYLDETPNGPLAEEALGRLLDVYDKSGRSKAAERCAERYLSLYPTGLFSESARQVLKN